MLKIYNTLGRELQDFNSIEKDLVKMYACGPTVYDFAHIGHGRKYVNDDLIKRTLNYLGYKVKHVMNITDVGHLVSDEDEGEDKLEKGAKKHGKTVWEVAQYFTEQFVESMNALNIESPEILCKATDHIPEQIEMIKKLFENGYAYDTTEAVYFDVTKFKNYSELSGQKIEEKEVGVREEVKVDSNKRHPADFALWLKRVGQYENHSMHWDSPWGDGFPGWHIECSAMSTKYLGDQFDIHTGGEDHIAVHHTNEIAQSEGATGKHPFVKYWIHHAFLKINNQKMSKSTGNYFTISDVIQKGYSPMALRYLYLTSHYRSSLNFTWEALDSAQNSYEKLLNIIKELIKNIDSAKSSEIKADVNYKEDFVQALENDFNLPQALAVLWEVTKSTLPSDIKLGTILDFDRVLGLNLEEKLTNPVEKSIPLEAKILLEERILARQNKNWSESDKIRDELKDRFGIEVKDTAEGQEII